MAELVFYNTLNRSLEPFKPLEPGRIGLYTCGPTVYNFAHIGNLRTFVFEDFLRRSLRYLGYQVHQVMNLTDIDDKIIRDATAAGQGIEEFTGPYVEAFFNDLDTLHVERAEQYPKATTHIAEMIELVETLVEKNYAYVTEDGSVYFRITSDEDYGRLSRIDPDQARRGERVADDEYEKEDVRDFVLWKATKPGEPSWDSPWGPGRPGWHIECSAMSMKYLGETFDIHCGGVDNIFPHHENEIAQSESATGKLFVHTWLHAEHLIVDGEKMSKSLGNQYTLQDLLDREISPRSLRYLFVSAHYRQKLNFSFRSVEAAGKALERIDAMRFRVANATEAAEARTRIEAAVETLHEGFEAGLADDLNASNALSALFGFVKTVNRILDREGLGFGDRDKIVDALDEIDQVLGVLDPQDWTEDSETSDDAEIDEMVRQRDEARANKDFAEADRLRDQLTERGIVIEDTPDGARWKRK